ncbi:MAG: sulfatase [Planctomycetaceae bacterium]|nr:sulfatase [Planctomycetaceae bacterium]
MANTNRVLLRFAIFLLLAGAGLNAKLAADEPGRPNILFAIADDWGAHAGAYDTPWVRTPTFDRLAQEGLLFRNAYTPMAKCATSRAILLTGRHLWQLKAAGNHMSYFPLEFKTWPEVLREHGWHTGITGKDWGPGIAVDATGNKRNLCGVPINRHQLEPPTNGISRHDYAANFRDFLNEAPANQPWCFWYSSLEPHRGFEFQSGVNKNGRQLADIDRVPTYWPDTETVRHDMLDYALEVEYADRQLHFMLEELEQRGLSENTIVIFTSDHGMPFPRAKGFAYRDSNHVPLAIRWPRGITRPGRVIDDFVDFTDVAPTLLELAGIDRQAAGMQPITGRSWKPIFDSEQAGQIVADRDHVLLGKERTDVGRPQTVGYPIRGLIRGNFLLLINFEPDRWPAGNPETGYLDTDGSPTKTEILRLGRQDRANPFWQLNFGKRPQYELFDLASDRDCVKNIAESPQHQERLQLMTTFLMERLKSQVDPRVLGHGHEFDAYSPTQGQNYYEDYLEGRVPKAGWVNPDDYEPPSWR